MGRLILEIHNELTPFPMEFEHDGEPFKIHQTIDGGIYIVNITIMIKNEYYYPYTLLNSKDNYPLMIDGSIWAGRIFDENGNFNQDFIEYFKAL